MGILCNNIRLVYIRLYINQNVNVSKTHQSSALLVRIQLNGPVQRVDVVRRPPFLRVFELAKRILHDPPSRAQIPQQRLVIVRRRRARTPQALFLQQRLEFLQRLLLLRVQMTQVAVRKHPRLLAGGRARRQNSARGGRTFIVGRHDKSLVRVFLFHHVEKECKESQETNNVTRPKGYK